MRKSSSAFTIVELLIVIVVIAILAAISIVAYNGVQARARDNIRYQDVKIIMKALELYKVDHGQYPPTSGTSSSNMPTGCIAGGYGYSYATDTSWLKPLVDGGYLTTAPTPPNNGCTSYYRYLSGTATSYSCARASGWYLLQVEGGEGSINPPESKPFQPCGTAPNWGISSSRWTFSKDE